MHQNILFPSLFSKLLTIRLEHFKILLFIGLYFGLSFCSFAQQASLKKIDLGLSSANSVVTKIDIDAEGYLWFLTNSNVYRYNGITSEAMDSFLENIQTATIIDIKTHENHIYLISKKCIYVVNTLNWSEKKILQLNEDEEIKEISYQNEGLHFYLSTSKNRLLFVENDKLIQQIDLKNKIHELPIQAKINKLNHYENKLYVSVDYGFVIEVELSNYSSKTYQLPTDKPIASCYKIDNNIFAEVFEEGIYNIQTHDKFDQIPSCFFKDVHILKVIESEVWGFSKDHSFNISNRDKSIFNLTIEGHLTDVLFIEEGVFLSTGLGIYQLNLLGDDLIDQFIPANFPIKSTRNIELTEKGRWISTYSGSFFSTTDSLYYFKQISYSTETLNDSMLALGTEGQGLQFFNLKTKKMDSLKNLNKKLPPFIKSLTQSNGLLYIGTEKGLFRYCLKTKELELIQHTNQLTINKISIINQSIYCSTNKGFVAFNNGELEKVSPENFHVKSHFITPTHFVLATMNLGLVVIARDNYEEINYVNTTNYTNTNTFFDVIEFKGLIYAFSEQGIYLFNPNEINQPIMLLGSNLEFNHNSIFKNTHELYAGHLDGWVKINPKVVETIRQRNSLLKLSAYNLFSKNGNEQFLINKDTHLFEIKLPAKVNAIQLSFGTNVNEPTARNQNYVYNLPEINTTWEKFSQKEGLMLANLSPRWNNIKVKKNRWEEEATLINIYKEPYFYETYWFYVFSILLLITVTYAIIYYKQHLRKIQTKIKEQISKDLHDEVGSQLSTISLQAELLKYKSEHEIQAKYLKSIELTSKEAIRSLNQIVWTLKYKEITWSEFINLLKQYSESVFELTETEVHFFYTSPLMEEKVNKQLYHNLMMIFKEILNNVLKHADASLVKIDIQQLDKHLIIIINDNGCGMKLLKNRTYGNGINNILERANENNIKIEIKSEIDKGTSYHLRITL